MELLVILSCLYSQGCEETAHAYYLKSPSLQDQVKYSQAQAEALLGKQGVVAMSTSLLYLSNKSWTYKLSDHVLIKGERQWENMSLSYQYYF